jgi:glutamyl-tRNA(Gln) amidotransferase subunit E
MMSLIKIQTTDKIDKYHIKNNLQPLRLDNKKWGTYIVGTYLRRMDSMLYPNDPAKNYEQTKKMVGYISRKEAKKELYRELGFRCGLEIHQQLKTAKKLFCRCPAGIYQKDGEYDAVLVRHMRPTLSELGEYDGTALMEFRTRKNIYYRIKDETACTYDFDDTPPFPINREALNIAIEVALLLKCSIVGELHITRKQYLDGSIPTGFQRTAIVGIDGEIPLKHKKVRIIQLSVEEDACREVSDIGHDRIYTTDRLGMPLIETVTYPDMLTPDEAAEAGQYLRFLTRSTDKVNTGIGAARQDVNVSITGGTRVEIKGVASIKRIPELTHNEAFRQKALLKIAGILNQRIENADDWEMTSADITDDVRTPFLRKIKERGYQITAVNLPEFGGLLSFFTQPGHVFADEIGARLRVITCLERFNMTHSESLSPMLGDADMSFIQEKLNCKNNANNAQVVFWSPEEDFPTALQTIDERCRLAFMGVPNETRQSLPDGTNTFERVLPGPDRMYPDTDSAPIPIEDELIDSISDDLPVDVADMVKQMDIWQIPADAHHYILRRNLFPVMEKIICELKAPPRFVGTLFGHTLKHADRQSGGNSRFMKDIFFSLFSFVRERQLDREILKILLPMIVHHPDEDFESLLSETGYRHYDKEDILSRVQELKLRYTDVGNSRREGAESAWVMGQLRPLALGNMDLKELRKAVDGDLS